MEEVKLEVVDNFPQYAGKSVDNSIRELTKEEKAMLERCPACCQKIEKPIPRTEIWKVIQVFKLAQGVARYDKQWDNMFYPRYMRPSKELIAFMGGWVWAADCIQDLYEKFTNKGLTVTFETILKHSSDWKKDRMEREAKSPEGIKIL